MPSLRPNLVKRIERLPKPNNAAESLQPLFEAVSNAIHSTQSRFGDMVTQDGKIFVTVSTERKKQDVSASVEDNGSGLDAMAVRGEGAWIQRPNGPTQPLQVASPAPLSKLAGNVSWRYLSDDLRRVVTGNFWKFAMTPDFRCAAHTYRLNASGHLHFAFSSSVLPWDHAAGWLIHREAGGYTAHFDGSPYLPVNRSGGLISAPDQETWHVVRDALLDGALASP